MIYPPADVHAATGKRRLEALSVVESGVAFEAVHASPVFERDFDEFGEENISAQKRCSGAERPK